MILASLSPQITMWYFPTEKRQNFTQIVEDNFHEMSILFSAFGNILHKMSKSVNCHLLLINLKYFYILIIATTAWYIN